MSLDYRGIPEFRRDRELTVSAHSVSAFLSERPLSEDVTDKIFDDIGNLFLKGDALKTGLGNMAPAAFIPVEDGASVVVSLQRRYPGELSSQITFGQFKEACDWITGRVSSLDEDFIYNARFIDPKTGSVTQTSHYKGVKRDGDDWITEFLLASSPFAGIMLAGFMTDVFGMNIPRTTVESNSSGNEPKLWHLQGFSAGIALLVELGVNYAALELLFSKSNSVSKDLMSEFSNIASSPKRRKEILEEHGYNYEALRANQKFDDYKAIKKYCLDYISAKSSETNEYDHWLAWLQVSDSQEIVKTAVSMAPTFSKKWKQFDKQFSFSSKSEDSDTSIDDIRDEIINRMNSSVRSYLSSMLTLTDKQYNSIADSFSFRLDERLVCCILYFLGPMDTSTLQLMSNMMKLATFSISVSAVNLITFLSESAASTILGMMATYVSKVMDDVVERIMSLFFSVPDSDLQAAIKLCTGLDFMFKIFQYAVQSTISFLLDVVEKLNASIQISFDTTNKGASIFVERKIVLTITALLDSIIAKFERVQGLCPTQDESGLDQRAADAAIEFVVEELPHKYPILNMPEDVRRKHFRNTGGFMSYNLGIEIPGFDTDGNPGTLEDLSTASSDCANNSSPTKSSIIAQRIVESFKRTK